MLNKEIKKKIDTARNILVGVLPLPSDQIELITIALIYKFMDDQDEELRSAGFDEKFFSGQLKRFSWQQLMSNQLSADQRVTKFINGIEAIQKATHIPLLFREIFSNTFLKFRDGRVLQLFLDQINKFTYDHSEELGNAFEYLLMTMGAQGDNGQFRTPRNIIDFIVEVVSPTKHDTIIDPACGTAGFLVSAYKHILRKNTSDQVNARVNLRNYEIDGISATLGDNLTAVERKKLEQNVEGYDNTPLMVRLARVNLYLHHFTNPRIHEYDTLNYDTRWKEKFDCIFANPPFMTPRGGIEPHDKFRIRANRTEILFADYILEHLTPNGKAGFIIPEGLIFQGSGDFTELRKWMIYEAGLWAVASLPAHIFQPYSGVKTSILFIDREMARTRSEILLLKIDNDGFSLNTNRTPIKENDLPDALDWLELCKKDPEHFKIEFANQSQVPFTKKLRLLHRDEFARLDSYKSTSAAFKFCQKAYERVLKNNEELKERVKAEKTMLGKTKDKQKKEKCKTNIAELNDKLQKNIREFLERTGISSLPATEKELRSWFDEKIKSAAHEYGVNLKNTGKLTRQITAALDNEREYSLNFDKYAQKGRDQVAGDLNMVKLIEVANFINGYPFKPTDWEEKGIPIIRIQNLTGSSDVLNYTTRTDLPEKYRVRHDDLLISWSATIGFYIWEHGDAWLNQHIFKVDVDEAVILRKYLYALREKIIDLINEKVHGNTMQHITKDKFESIEIPLPSIGIQKRVVDEISSHEEIVKGCDLIIDNHKPSFVIDGAWDIVKLQDICEVKDGTHDSPKYHEAGIPFLTQKNITKTGLSFEDMKFISEADHKKFHKRSNVGSGDILISMIGANRGMSCLVEEKRAFSVKNVGLIKPGKKINQLFLLYYLKSDPAAEYISASSKGGAQEFISLTALREFPIPLPTLAIQSKIVKEIDKELDAAKGTIALRVKAIQRIKLIINKVFGE